METGGRRGRGAVVQEEVNKQEEEGKKEKRSKRIKDKEEENVEVRKERKVEGQGRGGERGERRHLFSNPERVASFCHQQIIGGIYSLKVMMSPPSVCDWPSVDGDKYFSFCH